MDPVSAVQALYSLAISVQTWLDQRREKGETIRSLRATVNRICDVVAPFEHLELEKPVEAAFRGISDVLHRTKEHLLGLADKQRGTSSSSSSLSKNRLVGVIDFFSPARALDLLRQDEKDLNQQLIMMLFTLAVINNFQPKSNPPQDTASKPEPPEKSESQGTDQLFLDAFRNQDAAQFWMNYIGIKVLWAPEASFVHGIKTHFRADDDVCLRLMCYLDEYNTGGVTPGKLDELVGEDDLGSIVERFRELDLNPTSSHPGTATTVNLKTPLLIWVDDCPDNNTDLIKHARKQGIETILLTSTASAKEWIRNNEAFLKQHGIGSKIRIISDNSRIEFPDSNQGDETKQDEKTLTTNHSAGETILRFVRGRFPKIPVLIYTNFGGIPYTKYVEGHAYAGSTFDTWVAQRYIQALRMGKDSDNFWHGLEGPGRAHARHAR